MLKFIFLLAPYEGSGLYVQSANMTGAECIAALTAYVENNPALPDGVPSCEVDMAQAYQVQHNGALLTLPPCIAEDSDNCLWDGMTHGNGKGRTFYTIKGKTFYID